MAKKDQPAPGKEPASASSVPKKGSKDFSSRINKLEEEKQKLCDEIVKLRAENEQLNTSLKGL